MSSAYYYARNGQRCGPVSSKELKALADAGKLAPHDLLWKEGMAEWRPARELKGLFPEAAAAPAAPPPLPTSSPASASEPAQAVPEVPATAITTTPGAGWHKAMARVDSLIEKGTREFQMERRPVIALAAGVACLLLLATATTFTWAAFRFRMDMKMLDMKTTDSEGHSGLAAMEGKLTCVLVLAALVCLGVAFFQKRFLTIAFLVAGGVATCSVILILSYRGQVNRLVAGQKAEIEHTFGQMGQNELTKGIADMMGMQFEGGSTFGLYFALLMALAAAAAFVYAALRRPAVIPLLQKPGTHPLLQKHGGLIGAQTLAVLVGLIFFISRY